MRGPTEHSLSYRGPTLEPSVPVLGGGQTQGEKCGFWTNFFSTVASRGRNPANKKAIRDKCPISPTKSKSIRTEGSCPRTFPRVGPRVGPGLAGFPYVVPYFLPMLQGRAPRLLCPTRGRHWREGQSCNTATPPKRAGKEGTVVRGAGKCLAASNVPRTRAAPYGDRAQGSQPLGADT